jgi:hypothetical protein
MITLMPHRCPDKTNFSVAVGTHPLLKWCQAYRSPAGRAACLLGPHGAPLIQLELPRGATTLEDRPLFDHWDNPTTPERETHGALKTLAPGPPAGVLTSGHYTKCVCRVQYH